MRKILPPEQIRALCQRGKYAPLDPFEIKLLRESVDARQKQVAHATGYSVALARAWERTDAGARPQKRPARLAFCAFILRTLDEPSVYARVA